MCFTSMKARYPHDSPLGYPILPTLSISEGMHDEDIFTKRTLAYPKSQWLQAEAVWLQEIEYFILSQICPKSPVEGGTSLWPGVSLGPMSLLWPNEPGLVGRRTHPWWGVKPSVPLLDQCPRNSACPLRAPGEPLSGHRGSVEEGHGRAPGSVVGGNIAGHPPWSRVCLSPLPVCWESPDGQARVSSRTSSQQTASGGTWGRRCVPQKPLTVTFQLLS